MAPSRPCSGSSDKSGGGAARMGLELIQHPGQRVYEDLQPFSSTERLQRERGPEPDLVGRKGDAVDGVEPFEQLQALRRLLECSGLLESVEADLQLASEVEVEERAAHAWEAELRGGV